MAKGTHPAMNTAIQRPELTIAVVATFTAEPVAPALTFWMQELGLPAHILFSPYNQIFQQLLDPTSIFLRNTSGINLIFIRLEDWAGTEPNGHAAAQSSSATTEHHIREFSSALHTACLQGATTYLVCLCPPSPTAGLSAREITYLTDLLSTELSRLKNVFFVAATELVEHYQDYSYHDAAREALGHVPYTPAFFCTLATAVARRIYAIESAPRKVIVVDCDHTLWKGICGEDGPQGIEIDTPHRALQEFLVAQHDAGMLICLCSKNNEADVLEVFSSRPEMPLRLQHLVAQRINWQPKSHNLRSLAEELQLGLDSFVFIDDDSLECAEVQTHCPEVMTLQLPRDAALIPPFLKQLWALDHFRITDEDRKRTLLYQQNRQRDLVRQEALTLEQFVIRLGVDVHIQPMAERHLARAAQLTQRTNQFNCSTIRRSENELRRLWQSSQCDCRIIEVSDRFGEYGVVGVVLSTPSNEALSVDTFLLSCRVLGRGVEHRVLSELGKMAQERGYERVDIPFVTSRRNQPALNFLEQVGAPYKRPTSGGFVFSFPAATAAALQYRDFLQQETTVSDDSTADAEAAAEKQPPTSLMLGGSKLMQKIVNGLLSPEHILRVLDVARRRERPVLENMFVAPRTPVEEAVAEIWTQVLGIAPIGIHDKFFDLGGDSLAGTLLLSRISQMFSMELSLSSLFDAPTIAQLAEIIESEQIKQAEMEQVVAALKDLEQLSDAEVTALLAGHSVQA